MTLRNSCPFHHGQGARMQRTLEGRRQLVAPLSFFSVSLLADPAVSAVDLSRLNGLACASAPNHERR